MKIENLFCFTKYPRRILRKSILCCYIQDNIECENDLFNSLNEQLKFSVFGWNWDALHDSLCGFEGIKQRNIVIIHEKLNINEYILHKYILHIMRASLLWKKYSYEHRLFPIFFIADRDKIIKILYSKNIQNWFKIECEHFNLTC